jgi:catechol 2,3-dioxygenase-like lactoylglutathione lyase family enzyme
MSQLSRLGKYSIVGFVNIVDVARAKEFYRDTLGLRLVSEEPPFALVFEANGIMLRLGMAKELPPARGTVLGWQVPDISAAVKDLGQAGIRFERYEQMKQDELGIWTSPTGAKVAWFKDPDGNILSVSEHPELPFE